MLRRPFAPLVLLVLAALAGPGAASAQAPLFLADEDTNVRGVNFKFTDTQTLDEGDLRFFLATRGPGFGDRVKRLIGRVIPFIRPATYPLVPIEVQKDVVRMRQFYRLNGFLFTEIDYPASQLDTASNTIRVIYTITEGPPLRIGRLDLVAERRRGGTAEFEGTLEREWERFGRTTRLQPGDRFTSIDYALLKGNVLTWARNRGYAFALVEADSTINADSLTIDLRLRLTPGPRARVANVIVEGNETVGDGVVRREIPLQRGDRFSQRRLIQGQRELFGLGLFRVAVAEVPAQPIDSAVTIRYTVRETKPRLVTAQTGYGLDEGVSLQGQWTHRNFVGGARQLTVAAGWQPGFGAGTTNGFAPVQRINASVTLRQPYVFNRKTSALVSPYYVRERDPNLGSNYQEFGASTSLLYEILPFRTANVQYSFGRVSGLDGALTVSENEAVVNRVYDRSVFSASATVGKVNDFLNPRRGYIVRPSAEYAGGLIGSGIEYTKVQTELVGYASLSERVDGAARVVAGGLLPFGGSADQDTPTNEYRFDRIRFLAGGASDVRGWNLAQLGPQGFSFAIEDGAPVLPGAEGFSTADLRYEPVGGVTKVAGNLEGRLPFPGLGEAWRAALFVDAGYLDAGRVRRFDPAAPRANATVSGRSALRVGAGAGIRYLTPIGYLRFDLAFKVNPADTDLYRAPELYERLTGLDLEGVDQPGGFATFTRRLAVHISIGQAF